MKFFLDTAGVVWVGELKLDNGVLDTIDCDIATNNRIVISDPLNYQFEFNKLGEVITTDSTAQPAAVAVPGVEFTLFTDAKCENPVLVGGNNLAAVSDDDGLVLFEKLDVTAYPTTYYMKETALPAALADSYLDNSSVYKVVIQKDGTYKITVESQDDFTGRLEGTPEDGYVIINEPPTYQVTVVKVDADTDKKLGGVEFALYDETYLSDSGEVNSNASAIRTVTTVSTGSDEGKADLGKLPVGTYYLVETKTQNGYDMLTSPVKLVLVKDKTKVAVTVQGDAADLEIEDNTYNVTITVKNPVGSELPHVGGVGRTPYTAAGIALLLLCAGFTLVKLQTKKREE